MASRFWVGGTGTWDASDTAHWASSSGGAGGQSVPVDGDTTTFDGSSGGGTVTVGYDPTVTSITCGAFTGTLDFSTYSPTMATFSSTGTGTRTLTMTNMGTMTLTGTGTVWTQSTATNLTINPGGTIKLTNSSASARTMTMGSVAVNHVWISAGTGTMSLTSLACEDLDFTGYTGAMQAGVQTITGNLTFGSGMTMVDSGNAFNITGTGTKTITSNGVTINRTITINLTSGTRQAGDALTTISTRGITLTQGTFSDNGQTVSVGVFSSSNSNTRSLTNTGTINITGNNTTVWAMSIMTGFTLTQSGTINLTYSGSTGSRAISNATVANNGTQATCPALNVTAGTDTIAVSSGRTCGSINFTGFAGSWTPASATYYGSLILNSTMVVNDNGAITLTFAPTSGTHTISSNGNTTFGQGGTAIVINAPGATYQWGSDFYSQSSLTLTAGTLNYNNYNATSTVFSSSNSNTRTISMGSGTHYLTSTGTVWNTATTTNLTFNANTSTIIINDASASSKTFADGGLTFNNITMTGAGTGTFIMGTTTTTTTISEFIVDTPPHTVQVFAGKTLAITTYTISGTAGNLNTFKSTADGTQWFVTKSSGFVSSVDYISLQDSNASGGAIFYAGSNSTNVLSSNTGWLFSPFSPSPSSSISSSRSTSISTSPSSSISPSTSISSSPSSSPSPSASIRGILGRNTETGIQTGVRLRRF